MEDERTPYVSSEVVEYLERVYSVQAMLDKSGKMKNNDEHIGYIKGIHDVIGLLRFVSDNNYE